MKQIIDWFKQAKPQPIPEDFTLQVGCHFEEWAEMLACVTTDNASGLSKLHGLRIVLDAMVTDLKSGRYQLITYADTALLDAICDQIVTAVGIAHMKDYDVVGALKEVADSNDSKFENGCPIFDENGKIAKGKNYFAPDLEKFTK